MYSKTKQKSSSAASVGSEKTDQNKKRYPQERCWYMVDAHRVGRAVLMTCALLSRENGSVVVECVIPVDCVSVRVCKQKCVCVCVYVRGRVSV